MTKSTIGSNPTRVQRVTSTFNAKAEHYETNRLAPWYKYHADAVVNAMSPTGDDRILDIGCGSGYFLRKLATLVPGLTCIGIDLSDQMIKQARTLANQELSRDIADNIEFVHADWLQPDTQLQKKLAAFGATHASFLSSLHYFPDPAKDLARLETCLAPNARLWLFERERSRSLFTSGWDIIHRYIIKDHVRFFSSRELASHMRQAGFENVEEQLHLKRWMWKGKMFTNTVLLTAQLPDRKPTQAPD